MTTENKRMRQFRATTAAWQTNNIALLEGELALEVLADGTVQLRFGDGSTAALSTARLSHRNLLHLSEDGHPQYAQKTVVPPAYAAASHTHLSAQITDLAATIEAALEGNRLPPESTVEDILTCAPNQSYCGSGQVAYLMANDRITAVGQTTLGEAGTNSRLGTPVFIGTGGAVSIVKARATTDSIYGLTAAGNVLVGGGNDYGQCGLGNANAYTYFASVQSSVFGGEAVTEFYLTREEGSQYVTAFALTASGKIFACGANYVGQCGIGATGGTVNTWTRVGTLTGIVGMSVGSGYYTSVFAWDGGGNLFAWGYNAAGQLGLNDLLGRDTPTAVPALPNGDLVADVKTTGALSYGHTILRAVNGNVYCCGSAGFYQTGQGNTTDLDQLALVSGVTGALDIDVIGGRYGSCLARTATAVRVWGYNADGRCGVGTTATVQSPTNVTGVAGTLTGAFFCGGGSTCGMVVLGAQVFACGYRRYFIGNAINSSAIVSTPLAQYGYFPSLNIPKMAWHGGPDDWGILHLFDNKTVGVTGANDVGQSGAMPGRNITIPQVVKVRF